MKRILRPPVSVAAKRLRARYYREINASKGGKLLTDTSVSDGRRAFQTSANQHEHGELIDGCEHDADHAGHPQGVAQVRG
jgi:hypothetical protein